MDSLTRRKFLVRSGVVGGVALAGAAAGFGAYSLRDILDTAGERPTDAQTLVVITLYGGNDGLNTVIPFADAAYQSARPELAYSADEVLKLDATTGLNPGLKGLHGLYSQQRLAVVRGVGYPQADRSHFRSMDIWHTAQPARPGNTGWLGRWLDTAGGDPRLAVSFENVLPPLLAGASSAGAVVGVNGMKMPRTVPMETVSALGQAVAGEPALQARAAACYADLVRVDRLMKDVNEAVSATPDPEPDQPKGTGTGGQSALDSQLDLVAQCIKAKVATRAFSVSLGGFDTHADEKQPHQALLGILDKAVTSFLGEVAGHDVVVLIYSEFGRRVKANASDGTDHGTASNVLLIGPGFAGGLHGEQPSLTNLDNGDLKHSIDFRDIYATILERVLKADPAQILEGWKGRLAL
ncbi:hypothetical protein Rhe02_95230 [Rhizocola hellebori]|uniref:DUF1501 domain-containing protein n=1 Tax=Rhizocola hellebori TaxID=1392758 RepID=A0A8J3VMM1_9ACTN|nr:DUF1501 domain-containing protein [Rhizocola hellebori]GIH11456.1 hypothetical protein Rhe02_95230 [Rhizocola hellebori]